MSEFRQGFEMSATKLKDAVRDGVSGPIRGPIELPAGEYWIGDLGYVIKDGQWFTRVCKTYYKDAAVLLEDGHTALIYGSVKGDGHYKTSRDFGLGVDSGSLSIMPLNALDREDIAIGMNFDRGAVVEFPDSFICEQKRDDDLLVFGEIEIYL